MTANSSEIRYLTPPSVEIKRKILPVQEERHQVCRLQGSGISEEIFERTGEDPSPSFDRHLVEIPA